jgi:putative iron-only hydrogenase system regulator
MARKGIIGIIIEDHKNSAGKVNDFLHRYGNIIIARMGIHKKEENYGLISLIVEANTDIIGEFTGKLGQIKGVNVSSTMLKEK